MAKTKELKEASNRRTIQALYKALNVRDIETIQRLLASDIEWWYHGPPGHQYLMQFLTGTSSNSCRTSSASSSSSSDDHEDIEDSSFSFVPCSITAFGSLVIVEGCDLSRSVSWIHVWTVSDDNGIVTELREYFNTSLTIKRFENNWNSNTKKSSTSKSSVVVWESKLSSTIGKSVPDGEVDELVMIHKGHAVSVESSGEDDNSIELDEFEALDEEQQAYDSARTH